MRVLVTGGGGFISGHLIRTLLDQGDEVVAVDRKPLAKWKQVHGDARNVERADLADWATARDVADGCERIYHLAAESGGMGFIATHMADCTLSVIADAQVIRAARRVGARAFLASSACVYPLHMQLHANAPPLREADAYSWPEPEEAYGWEKLFAERMWLAHAADHDVAVRIGRIQSAFGPHCAWRDGREKAPIAICRKVAEAKAEGRDWIEVWGDGTAIRTFTYVDDVTDAIIAITDCDYGQPLNIGTDQTVSVAELVSVVSEIADHPVRMVRVDGPVGVPGARRCDTSLTAAEAQWKARFSVREGLERTYAWAHDMVAASR